MMMVMTVVVVRAFRVGQWGRSEEGQKCECEECLFHNVIVSLNG
jgi:hypothetical protein